jgi:hypothetical protein
LLTIGDTGNSEHLKYSPQCSFYQKTSNVENVPIGQEDTPVAKKIIEAALLDSMKKKIIKASDGNESISF